MNPTENEPATPTAQPPAFGSRRAIHYTELPECSPDSQIATESNYYRREVGRLLAEGQEGRWVLIKGEQVIGIWDTRAEAFAVADERFLLQPVLVRQILEWEPLIRLPLRWYLWHNLRSQSS
jgi:hypothetical protein